MRPANMRPMADPSPVSFARRRKQLMRIAGEDAILILPSAPERIRSRDTHYPYRQDSDLLYLAGFPEPDGKSNPQTIGPDVKRTEVPRQSLPPRCHFPIERSKF